MKNVTVVANQAPRDKVLEAAKRERQEHARASVRSGDRTQESMGFIAPSIVKTLKIRHRTVDF